MTRLDHLKLAHSVKLGVNGREELYFSSKDYELTLDKAFIIEIKDKRTSGRCFTSLFNAIYWIPSEEQPLESKTKAKKVE